MSEPLDAVYWKIVCSCPSKPPGQKPQRLALGTVADCRHMARGDIVVWQQTRMKLTSPERLSVRRVMTAVQQPPIRMDVRCPRCSLHVRRDTAALAPALDAILAADAACRLIVELSLLR